MDNNTLIRLQDKSGARVQEIVDRNHGFVTPEYRALLLSEYLVEETIKECARLAYALTEDEFVEYDMLRHYGVKHG